MIIEVDKLEAERLLKEYFGEKFIGKREFSVRIAGIDGVKIIYKEKLAKQDGEDGVAPIELPYHSDNTTMGRPSKLTEDVYEFIKQERKRGFSARTISDNLKRQRGKEISSTAVSHYLVGIDAEIAQEQKRAYMGEG